MAVTIQEWQIKEIKEGIAEADAGQLVDHSSVVKYWERRGNRSRPNEKMLEFLLAQSV